MKLDYTMTSAKVATGGPIGVAVMVSNGPRFSGYLAGPRPTKGHNDLFRKREEGIPKMKCLRIHRRKHLGSRGAAHCD